MKIGLRIRLADNSEYYINTRTHPIKVSLYKGVPNVLGETIVDSTSEMSDMLDALRAFDLVTENHMPVLSAITHIEAMLAAKSETVKKVI